MNNIMLILFARIVGLSSERSLYLLYMFVCLFVMLFTLGEPLALWATILGAQQR